MILINIDMDGLNALRDFLFCFMIFIPILFFLINFPLQITAQNLSYSISLKANAGEDQYVEEGQPVILNAEDSLSSNPPIDSFFWRQVEPKNPIIELENSHSEKASFIAPNLPNQNSFVFQLIVQDENVTDTDTVNIFVTEDLGLIDEFGNTIFEPEICFDGLDNDFDGKIDIQDEECVQTNPSQLGQLYQQLPPEVQQHQNPFPVSPGQQQNIPQIPPGIGQHQPEP